MDVLCLPLVSTIFCLGLAAIVAEHWIKIDKSASAILTGILCWAVYFLLGDTSSLQTHQLSEHISDISQILFFLIGAMLVVEVIDAHRGFDWVGKLLCLDSPRRLGMVVMVLAFFLSSVLDNLTTIIVMICLLRKVVACPELRRVLAAAMVPAVNLGGAWTPIGDITTTMLWVSGCVSVEGVMLGLFVPCCVALIVLLAGLLWLLPKEAQRIDWQPSERPIGARRVLVVGLAVLILVPVLKAAIGLPPFMGMLLGVAFLWAMTDLAHSQSEERRTLRVFHILGRIDMSSVLFFLGILLAVDALESVGALHGLADRMQRALPAPTAMAGVIGVASSLIDNVPLVAACIKMYPLAGCPTDSAFWNLLAYCAGTGGSILVIGSAPGIAVMTMEGIGFGWYLRRISLLALVTYIAGLVACVIQMSLWGSCF